MSTKSRVGRLERKMSDLGPWLELAEVLGQQRTRELRLLSGGDMSVAIKQMSMDELEAVTAGPEGEAVGAMVDRLIADGEWTVLDAIFDGKLPEAALERLLAAAAGDPETWAKAVALERASLDAVDRRH